MPNDVQQAESSPAAAVTETVKPVNPTIAALEALSKEERQKHFFEGTLPKVKESETAPVKEKELSAASAKAESAGTEAVSEPDEEENAQETPQERKKRNRNLRNELLRANERARVLQEQLELAESRKSAPAAAKAETGPSPEEQALEELGDFPDPGEFDNPKDFQKACTKYAKDLTALTLKLAREATKKERESEKQAGTVKSLSDRLKAAKEKHKDWDTKVGASKVHISDAMKSALFAREDGWDLIYKLTELPEEAERIAKAAPDNSPKSQARAEFELDAFAEKLKTHPPEKTEPKITTSVPPPPRSISGQAAGPADPLRDVFRNGRTPASVAEMNRILDERTGRSRSA